MQLRAALTVCALAFSAPFAIGSEGLIEDRVWSVAHASGSAQTLQVFVDSFPHSRFVKRAEEKIVTLRHRALVTRSLSDFRYVQ